MMTLPRFLAVWVVMMTVMMAPSVYPAVQVFAGAARSRRDLGARAAPLWGFLSGYLLMWAAFGVPAWLLISWVPMGMFGPGAQGIALLGAGAWQLSRWKSACLGHCRSPVFFLMHAWHDGPEGALLMGAHHGAYCVACCWGLMLVLIVMGVMNVGWMLVIAAVVFAEKVLPHGPRIARVVGVVLVVAGIVLVVRGMH